MRGPSLEDSLMGVGRGYSAYVLGTRNIFLFRSAKQERETKLERGSTGTLNLRTRKKLFIQERGNVEREGKIEEQWSAGTQSIPGTRAHLCTKCFCPI